MTDTTPGQRQRDAEMLRLRQEVADLKSALRRERRPVEEDRGEHGAAMFRAIYDQAPHLIGVINLDGTVRHFNRTAEEFLGAKPAHVIGKPFWETPWWTHSTEEQERLREGIRRAGQGEFVQFEATHRTADGESRRVDFTMKPARDDAGQVVCLIAEAQDITARKRAEEVLRESESRFRSMTEQSPFSVQVYSPQGRVLEVNRAFEELWGVTKTDLEGYNILEDRQIEALGFMPVVRRAFAGERVSTPVVEYDARATVGAGRRIFVQGDFYPVRDARGAIQHVILVHQDITDRKRAEEALRRERMLVDAILDSVPGLLYLYDDQGKLVRWNKQHEEITGYSAEELGRMHLMDWYRGEPEEAARIAAAVQQIAVRGHAEEEASLVTKSGKRIRFYFTAVGVQIDGRGYFVGIGIDVTERRKTEAALRASEQRFRRLVQNSNDLIAVVDRECVQASVSGPVERILGYAPEELIGQNGIAFVHPDDVDTVKIALAEVSAQPGSTRRAEYRYRHKNGGWVALEAVGTNLLHDPSVHGIVMNIRDISERKAAEEERSRLQEQLQQAMRMEAVGRLAGGIAHDFNNLLTAITGNVELARLGLSASDPLSKNLEVIAKATESAAALTGQLLAFSRRQIVEPRVLNLNDLIGKLQPMLARLIREDIVLQARLGEDLGSVRIDPGQFEHVLVNLVVNARDAMPNGGTLLIETANRDLDAEYCANHPDVESGEFVLLAVSDTGHGMSPDVKRRIFEPFFTTKPTGRGTGLGLATIFGAVKQAGGAIDVYSEEGLGTTFKIYLPRIEQPPERLVRETLAKGLTRGHETVLLVEDEASVRDLTSIMLKQLGYEVLPASNGGEALLLAEKHAGRIDLLMTDVVMPRMNGRELAERLRRLKPDLKVLFTSGYTEDVIVHHGIVTQELSFIGKPYSLHALATKLREVLDPKPR